MIVRSFLLSAVCVFAAAPDPVLLFDKHCAICHRPASETRAPLPAALARLPKRTILAALETGGMKAQGATLTAEERLAIAEYLAAKSTHETAAANPCPPAPALKDIDGWNGWGVDYENSRFMPGQLAGLSAGTVPKLKVRWAFAFPNASSAFGQPSIAGGRVFVGSQDGTVYSLDARSGCVHWTYKAAATVRSAISLGRIGPRFVAYFGDLKASVYSVDADTGALIWQTHVDEHRVARITAAPKLYGNRLYIPVSSVEEVSPANAAYECCTFRGSVVALDTATGKQIWKTYTITEVPSERGRNAKGTARFGPAGAAVWNSPTLDVEKKVLYVGTGNSYADPAAPTTDSVLAMDMENGSLLWSQQLTPRDGWNFSCSNPDPANCPDSRGEDYDVGSSPIIRKLADGRRLLIVGQKSGIVHALDAERKGAVVWQTAIGKGSALGGIMWGSAADPEIVYVPLSAFNGRKPAEGGGLFALRIATGEKVWSTPAPPPTCIGKRGCSAAQMAPATLIPGVVFSGSLDGHLRAYAAADGKIIWDLDTLQDVPTVNGVKGQGGSLSATGATVYGGMLFVNSGYGALAGMPGNLLLALSVDGR